MSLRNIAVIIPIYNPDDKFNRLLESLARQTEKFSVILIDSGTDKSYRACLKRLNFSDIFIKDILSNDFNHGGTRQWGMNLYKDIEIAVFLTQDAILKDSLSIERLVEIFTQKEVGAAFGRQLPHSNASIFARVAREFNYGKNSYVYDFYDRKKYGMKTCFISNSFAAYRKSAMGKIGGFPINTILSEDMYAAARLLMAGYKVAYVSDACVYHSHNYTVFQEFRRYFDIGVFHAREKWIRDTFGAAEGAGRKFLLFEIYYISRKSIILLILQFYRNFIMWCGFRLGLMEKILPLWMKRHLSMNKQFWNENV